jgi:hypothetical protein
MNISRVAEAGRKAIDSYGPGKALTIESQDLALLLGSPLLLVGYKSFALAGNRNR